LSGVLDRGSEAPIGEMAVNRELSSLTFRMPLSIW